jgi:AsmA family protein
MRPVVRWAIAGAAVLAILGAAAATAPLWLRPVVAARAGAALGRDVQIGRLAVIGLRPLRVALHDVRVASPPELAATAPHVATIARLDLTLALAPVWRGGLPDISEATLTGLRVTALQQPDGANNYTFALPGGALGSAPRLGVLRVQDGAADLQLARIGAQARITLATEADATITADIDGTYGGQQVTGRIRGAPITALADTALPYAVEAKLASGRAELAAKGIVAGPLQPAAAQLQVELSGASLDGLEALTGIPFPPTPPFRLAAATRLDAGVVRLAGLHGQLGSSDLRGDLALDLTGPRPVLSGDLVSEKLDLQDLAGFIGSQPGRATTPGLTPEQRQAIARAEASPRLIPNLPMDLPRIAMADFHIAYRGERIIGPAPPFDSLVTRLDIEDGHIRLSDTRMAVGSGAIEGVIDMTPGEGGMRTRADLSLRRLEVRRLLAAAGDLFQGDGRLGGRIEIDSVGRSLAEILQRGTGRLTFFMAGGSVSQLVVDLSGLQIGEALFSALGLPDRTTVRCLIGDLALGRGMLTTSTLLLDTGDDRTVIQGTLDLRTETVRAELRTRAKHFTVGTLAAPILVTGTLKNLGFAPGAGELAARGAGAVGLGLLFAPAALLATIQLGIGEDNACAALAAPPR